MDLKTEQETYWQHLTKLPHMDAIFRACEALEAENISINRDRVRERSGVTPTNLLAAGIKLYRTRQDTTDEFTKTPAVLLHLIGQSLENAFESMASGFDDKVKEIDAHYQSIAESLQTDFNHQVDLTEQKQQQIDELKSLLEKRESDIEHLQSTLQKKAEEQASLTHKYNQLLQEHRDLQQSFEQEKQRNKTQAQDHQQALETIKQEHEKSFYHLTLQHDKAHASLMTQLGNERGEWSQERKQLEEAVRLKTQALQESQTKVDQLAHDKIELFKQIQSLEAVLPGIKTLKEANQALEHQCQVLETQGNQQQKLQAELEHHQQEIAFYKSLLSKLPTFEAEARVSDPL